MWEFIVTVGKTALIFSFTLNFSSIAGYKNESSYSIRTHNLMLDILVYNSSLVNQKWQWEPSSNTSYRYRLQLTSMFPISVHLCCNRIQYPLLCSSLYMEYACHPVPSVQSLLLSLVALLFTHMYAHTACACRSPCLFYLKFQSQQNCDGATLQESGWSQDRLVCSTASSPNLSCSTCLY